MQLLGKRMKHYSVGDYLDKGIFFFVTGMILLCVISDRHSDDKFSFVSAAPGGKSWPGGHRKEVWLSLWQDLRFTFLPKNFT